MDEQQQDVLDLRDYLAVLRRRRWTVVQTVVVVVLVALAFTFTQAPRYEAQTSILVQSMGGGDTDEALRRILFGQQELETQRELVTSRPVALEVAERLGWDDPEMVRQRVEVTLLRDTQILEVRATSTEPAEAAEIAQTVAEAYLQFRRDQALEQVLIAAEALQEREAETRERLEEVEEELRRTGGDDPALLAEQQGLQTELASLTGQRASLRASEVFARGGGQIIQPAEIPEEPFAPRPLRTGILALVLGLMLGVGLAFLRDFLDDAIRSDDQARRATGQPVLGHVPRWTDAETDTPRLVTLVQPSSPVSEAYKTLRTNVRFMTAGSMTRSVLVTSPLAGEGKTTTAANLAVALARGQTRVLLVGSDLRKPTVHRFFGIEPRPGLSEVLIGDAEIGDVVVDVGVPQLRVIPGGTAPPNPAELLSSPAMASLMRNLEQIAGMVIYDGPPVMPVADALELGPRVGSTLLVVDTGVTGRHALRSATQRLEGVGAHVTGVILNRIDPDDAYYGYEYYDSYESDPSDVDSEEGSKRRFGRRQVGAG